MPNRYLREAFKESESINALGFQAEVTWTRLVVTVDDWGRCEANIKLLRAKLFPLRLDQVREAELSRWISECETAGLLRLYEVNGKQYIQMMKWEKGRAAKSKHPDPPPEIANKCFHLQTDVNNRKQVSANAPDSDSDSDSDTDSESEGARSPVGSCEIPSLAEFKAAFMADGMPEEWLERQYDWFQTDPSGARWLTQRGTLIDWKIPVRGRWKEDRPKWRAPGQAGPMNTRPATPWELEKIIERKKSEMKSLKERGYNSESHISAWTNTDMRDQWRKLRDEVKELEAKQEEAVKAKL